MRGEDTDSAQASGGKREGSKNEVRIEGEIDR